MPRKATPIQDTLIGILKFKRDLSIAQYEHWYRIPVKTAPAIVRDGTIKYLALYQPKEFGDAAYRIEQYAEVKKISVVKRKELLPDEPGHSSVDDDYYKIEFPGLIRLPEPIVSRKHRRLIFVTTTYARLRKAHELNDVFLESPIEERLWEGLRKAGIDAERQYWLELDDKHLFLDFAIFAKTCNINIECDGDAFHTSEPSVKRDKQRDNLLESHGWSVLRYTTDDIMNALPRCINQIRKTVQRHGGMILPSRVLTQLVQRSTHQQEGNAVPREIRMG